MSGRGAHLARWAAAGLLRATGMIGARARARRLGGRWGIVLRYHRVIPRDEPHSDYRIGIDEDLFRAQIAWIAGRMRVIDLEEYLRWVSSGKTPDDDLAILTFDDGYRDNLTHAAPILAEAGLPATFYVTAACMTERMPFWTETVAAILRLAPRRIARVELNGGPCEITTQDELSRYRSCHAMIARLRRAPLESVAAALERIADTLGVDLARAREETPPVMSGDDVRALAARFRIGSHTVGHPYLPAETAEAQRVEIFESKRFLEDAIRTPVLDFCYPGGGFDETSRRLAEEAGYRSATTTRLGIAGPADDPYRIPRIGVGEALARGPSGRFSAALMEAEVRGIFMDLYRGRKRARAGR